MQYSMTRRFIVSVLCILSLGHTLHSREELLSSSTELPAKIREAWTQLAQQELSVTGSYNVVKNTKNNERVLPSSSMHIKRMPGYFLMEQAIPDKDKFLFSYSPSYLFTAIQKKGSNEWVLEKLYTPKDRQEAYDTLRGQLGVGSSPILNPLSAIGISKTGLSWVDGKTPDPIKEIKFSVPDNKLVAISEKGFNMEMELDSSCHYMIKSSYEFLPPVPYTLLGKVSKTFLPNQTWPGTDLPLLKSYTYSLINDKTKSNLTHLQVDISDYQFTAPPKEIFTLAYYGLPEPEVKTVAVAAGFPNYLLYIIAALVAALFAFVIWKYSASKPQGAGQ